MCKDRTAAFANMQTAVPLVSEYLHAPQPGFCTQRNAPAGASHHTAKAKAASARTAHTTFPGKLRLCPLALRRAP